MVERVGSERSSFPEQAPRGDRLPYAPGLDGLRAISLFGILLFHSGFGFASGGFLGVSLFFTLSGFLITSLLLHEERHTGRVDLARFWARRFRRLMPASLLGLLLIACYGALLGSPDQLRRLRGDGLSALLYVSNWRFMEAGQSYFELFARPSPVQHFWSLSIEEQFYLVFPLGVALLLARARDRSETRHGPLVVATILLALASAALGPALLEAGASTSRIYYGTDTRAAEFLAGALLAVWLRARGWESGGAAQAIGGVAGVAVLAAWTSVPHDALAVYRGGLALHALLSALVIRALVSSGPLTTLVSARPLRSIGRISYGAYVYHWPIFLALDADRTGLAPPALLALRVTLTLAAAALSYYGLERPIRYGHGGSLRRAVAVACVAFGVVAASLLAVTRDPPLPWHVDHGPWQARPLPEPAPRAPEGPVRIMVFGDSLAWNLGRGLETWAERRPERATVWNMATFGCGIARGGERTLVPRTAGDNAGCENWPDWWPIQLGRFDPDVVVVHTGPWDLVDRRLPAWEHPLRPGDPHFDAWLVDEYVAAVDALSADGARVVWVTTPCAGPPHERDRIARAGAYEPGRIRHLNEVLLPRVREQRPDRVEVFDLFGLVCPDGEYAQDLPGLGRVRPDHVHLSDRATLSVARVLGQLSLRLVASGSDGKATRPR